jgi:hypothetical protein
MPPLPGLRDKPKPHSHPPDARRPEAMPQNACSASLEEPVQATMCFLQGSRAKSSANASWEAVQALAGSPERWGDLFLAGHRAAALSNWCACRPGAASATTIQDISAYQRGSFAVRYGSWYLAAAIGAAIGAVKYHDLLADRLTVVDQGFGRDISCTRVHPF